NLTQIKLPKPQMNSNENERMFYNYTYDNRYNQFVEKVTDAHSFESETRYTNFGMPTISIDINGNEFIYNYDPTRRMVVFKGPYNNEWTIRNQYFVSAFAPNYAVTMHNLSDEEGSNASEQVLHTSSFSDGLG